MDDRLNFYGDGPFGPADSGATDGSESAAAAVSSDWLLAGETARAGMIDSVSAENSGRSGTKLVDDGVFQTRMLCPSQVSEMFVWGSCGGGGRWRPEMTLAKEHDNTPGARCAAGSASRVAETWMFFGLYRKETLR